MKNEVLAYLGIGRDHGRMKELNLEILHHQGQMR